MRFCATLLLLLWVLPTPATAEADRERPAPERVYQQLREEPVIRTREEALDYLAEASAGDLRRSAKLSIDRRIKEVLSHPGFESLDAEIQSKLHEGMLEIRESFWTGDWEKLSKAGSDLREVSQGGKIGSIADHGADADELQERVLRLLEEVGIAVTLERCLRAREEHQLGPADFLECLLRGGSDG